MSSYIIVVALYNESTEWLKKMNMDNVVVYNKGKNDFPNSIPRKNVGREVETFFYHIVNHYYDLPEYVIFLQGNPFDHFSMNITTDNIQEKIDTLVHQGVSNITPLYRYIYEEIHSFYLALKCQDYYSLLFDGEVPNVFSFCPGCQYIIPKKNILSRPIQFYMKIHSMLLSTKTIYENDAHFKHTPFNCNEMNGWTMERLMMYIFLENIPISNYMKQKRYLVTGGAGFIGSNLVHRLSAENNSVIVLDNFSTGNLDYIDKTSMDSTIKKGSNINIMDANILDNDVCYSVGYVDGIFHLAAMSKVLPSLENKNMINFCVEQNILGTINVLKYASSFRYPIKVIYSASSTYYGRNEIPNVHPCFTAPNTDSSPPIAIDTSGNENSISFAASGSGYRFGAFAVAPAPSYIVSPQFINTETQIPDCQTPYALSKYCGELYCDLFYKLYKVPNVRLRYFMVYGKNEPSTGAYAVVTGIFLKRHKENQPLIIHGDGSQTRDFVHVDDICEANILAMNNTELVNDIINVGTGESISIKELATWISPSHIHVEERKMDMKHSLCDTTKLKEKLHWIPKRKLKDYITEVLEVL